MTAVMGLWELDLHPPVSMAITGLNCLQLEARSSLLSCLRRGLSAVAPEHEP